MNTYRLPRQWTFFSVFSVAVRSKPNQLSDRRGARFHLWCPHCLSGRPEESLLLIKSKTLTQSEVILSTLSSLSPMTHKLGAEKFLNSEMASSSLSEICYIWNASCLGPRAAAVAKRKSSCLMTEISCVQFPLGAWLFSLSILSYVYLTRYLEEVQHYLFSYHAAWGKTSLISTVWDLKKELLV